MNSPTITAAVKLPPAAIRELSRRLRRAARRMGVPAVDLTGIHVHLVDDAEIQRLNLQHMGEDRPTDVLSFPARSPDAPPIHPVPEDDADADDDADDDESEGQGPPPVGLGDIVLSWDAVRRQAGARPSLDEATVLLIHGLAHLLGHDHTGRRDGRAMHRRERRGLSAAHVADIPRPYSR